MKGTYGDEASLLWSDALFQSLSDLHCDQNIAQRSVSHSGGSNWVSHYCLPGRSKTNQSSVVEDDADAPKDLHIDTMPKCSLLAF